MLSLIRQRSSQDGQDGFGTSSAFGHIHLGLAAARQGVVNSGAIRKTKALGVDRCGRPGWSGGTGGGSVSQPQLDLRSTSSLQCPPVPLSSSTRPTEPRSISDMAARPAVCSSLTHSTLECLCLLLKGFEEVKGLCIKSERESSAFEY